MDNKHVSTMTFEGHKHVRANNYVVSRVRIRANDWDVLPDDKPHHFLRDRTIEPWDMTAAIELYDERVAYVGREAALHEVLTATAPIHGRESKRDYTARKDRLIEAIRKAGRNVRKAKSPGGIPAGIKQSKNARRKRIRYGKG